MRAYQRQEGESAKAFAAFEVYRDLGAERSLAKAAELIYGKPAVNLRQVEEWSRKHDWVDRARHFDDWHTMLERGAVERYLAKAAEDMGRREAQLRERALAVREKAMTQAERMLDYPLLEQKVLEADEDGTPQTLIFVPARWNKATAVSLFNMAIGSEPPEEPDPADQLDFANMTDEEVYAFRDLYLKAMNRDNPQGPGAAP